MRGAADLDLAEGIAIGVWRQCGSPDVPISAFEFARMCDARVEYDRHSWRVGRNLYVREQRDMREVHWELAHELGHLLIERARELQSEPLADAIAACLLLPRSLVLRDVETWGTDAAMLSAIHCHVPVRVIRWRLRTLRSSSATGFRPVA